MPLRDHFADRKVVRSSTDSPFAAPVLAVVATIVLLLALFGLLYWKQRSVSVEVDQQTLCPVREAPPSVLVILLDASDRFSEAQKLQLRNILIRLRDSIPRFGLVESYGLDRFATSVPKPLLHLCNPGTGADLSSLYQNPDLAKKKWRVFSDTLLREVERQTSGREQRISPIFEAIQAIAVRTLGQPQYDGVPKSLVIVSDLLQNVPGRLDMYRAIPPFETFRATPYYAQVRADLDGVSISAVYLDRPHVSTQGLSHIRFWESYFKSQHAVLESVYHLFGDQ